MEKEASKIYQEKMFQGITGMLKHKENTCKSLRQERTDKNYGDQIVQQQHGMREDNGEKSTIY